MSGSYWDVQMSICIRLIQLRELFQNSRLSRYILYVTSVLIIENFCRAKIQCQSYFHGGSRSHETFRFHIVGGKLIERYLVYSSNERRHYSPICNMTFQLEKFTNRMWLQYNYPLFCKAKQRDGAYCYIWKERNILE